MTTATILTNVTSSPQIAALTATKVAACDPRVTPTVTRLMHMVTTCIPGWAMPLTVAQVALLLQVPNGNSTHVSSRSRRKPMTMVITCRRVM